jgi:hypothetical protein
MKDIFYNPWSDDDFDQNYQISVPDVLPMEEYLPTEREALQSMCSQHDDIEEYNSEQDPWELYEETVIAYGQAPGYDLDHELSNKSKYESSGEIISYSTTKRKKRQKRYLSNNLIERKLLQVKKLLQFRINGLRLNRILWILADVKFLLQPFLSKSFKDLNKAFDKLYFAKTKSSQDKLVKQVIKQLNSYYNQLSF